GNANSQNREVDEAARRLYDVAKPALVEIHSYSTAGSGFFADDKGHVITAAHVVLGSIHEDVVTSDGRKFQAKIIALNPIADLAELELIDYADKDPYLPIASNQSE